VKEVAVLLYQQILRTSGGRSIAVYQTLPAEEAVQRKVLVALLHRLVLHTCGDRSVVACQTFPAEEVVMVKEVVALLHQPILRTSGGRRIVACRTLPVGWAVEEQVRWQEVVVALSQHPDFRTYEGRRVAVSRLVHGGGLPQKMVVAVGGSGVEWEVAQRPASFASAEEAVTLVTALVQHEALPHRPSLFLAPFLCARFCLQLQWSAAVPQRSSVGGLLSTRAACAQHWQGRYLRRTDAAAQIQT